MLAPDIVNVPPFSTEGPVWSGGRSPDESEGRTTRQRMSDFSLILGAALIVQASATLVLAACSFAIGLPMTRAVFPLSLGIMAAFAWGHVGRRFRRGVWAVRTALLTALGALFWLAIYIAGLFYDVSWDGQTYHQEAIIQLCEGWNPFREHLTLERLPEPFNIRSINHYARGAETIQASLYKVTGNIEHGKAFNLLLMVASLCLCFGGLLKLREVPVLMALAIGLLVGLNPVSVYQCLGYYVDGQLASLVLSLLAIGLVICVSQDSLAPTVWAATIVLLINVKSTGVAYSGLITLGLMICLAARKMWSRTVRLARLSAMTGAFGFCFVGFSPYVTNAHDHGHPFFPLAGKDPLTAEIMPLNTPINWTGFNRFEMLFHSVFSRTEDAYYAHVKKVSHLKNPFSVNRDEYEGAFAYADIRVGGWGPLFGAAVIPAAVILLMALSLKPRIGLIGLGVMLLIFLTAVVNPAMWWARLAPQLWAIPLVGVVLACFPARRLFTLLGWSVVFVLGINVVLVTKSYVKTQLFLTDSLRNQLAALAQEGKPIVVQFYRWRSNRIRLRQAGVPYREVDFTAGAPPPKRDHLVMSRTTIFDDRWGTSP